MKIIKRATEFATKNDVNVVIVELWEHLEQFCVGKMNIKENIFFRMNLLWKNFICNGHIFLKYLEKLH